MATDLKGELAMCGCGLHGWIVDRTHWLELVDARYWIAHEDGLDVHENRVENVRSPEGGRIFRMALV